MNNFRNVLIISPYYKYRKGGIASVIQLYKKHISSHFNYAPSIYFQNIYLSLLFFPINLIVVICKLLLNRNLKIIHIHGSHGGSFFRKFIIFWIGKKIFKKKIVYHLHSSDFQIFYKQTSIKTKEKISYLISNSDVIIVLSEEWKDYILSKFSPKKIRVLENIVEKQEGIISTNKSDKINLLFLGRIGKRKGVFDLIDCINSLNNLNKKNIVLTIGGDGEIDKLLKKISSTQLKNIRFVGWVKGEIKNELLRNSDVFVLPSYNEGLPISLLEAMSFGKPIVSTNVGGIPRILKNNLNGYLIEPGNLNQLENALMSYIHNRKLIELHGKEGLKIVQDYYPDRVLEKLNTIYADIL